MRLKYIALIIALTVFLVACGSIPKPTPSLDPTFKFLNYVKLTEEQRNGATKSGIEFKYEGVYVLNEDTLFLFGALDFFSLSSSLLLRSSDGGQHWQEVMDSLPANSIMLVTFTKNGEGWAVAGWTAEDMGRLSLYHSIDYGQTWDKICSDIATDYGGYGIPIKITFVDKDNGEIQIHYYAGYHVNQVITFTTSDGGETWTAKDEVLWRQVKYKSKPLSVYEIVGDDGSNWRVEEADKEFVISQHSESEDRWMVVSRVPKRFGYLNGHIISP